MTIAPDGSPIDLYLHPFVARLLDDEELDQELASAGLRPSRVLGERRTWVEARLYSAP
jgi:hypothetical protein